MEVLLTHRRINCAKASLYKKVTPHLLNFKLAGSPKRMLIDKKSKLHTCVPPTLVQRALYAHTRLHLELGMRLLCGHSFWHNRYIHVDPLSWHNEE